eukprot:SAG31_NODE_10033_length_1193_cov_1.053931_3_plen_87_part_00
MSASVLVALLDCVARPIFATRWIVGSMVSAFMVCVSASSWSQGIAVRLWIRALVLTAEGMGSVLGGLVSVKMDTLECNARTNRVAL